jgi:NAD(P)-dependent dehydrogenase (short-subunit alcohol dehydrogenase family)
MDLGLKDSVVLVTGGSSGLGRALVRTLASEGARVAFCGRDADRVRQVADEVTAAGADTIGVPTDVTEPEQLAAFVQAAVDRWGGINALVNNAGTGAGGKFEENDDAYWERDLQLKLFGAIRASRLVLPHLRASGGGSILNTLAIWGKAPQAGTTPSSVSRAAGLGLVKALSKEFGADNIRVNAILIGLIDADQWHPVAERQGLSVPALYEALAKDYGIPLGRVGSDADFANLAAFMLSPLAQYISGAAINLDGGLSPVV